ncbi:MAG: type II 3-dehydroquinate dehydratase [Bacteroidota bacterium]
MRISIINGPNLNLTGTREPSVYGTESFDRLLADLSRVFPGHEFTYFQSNIEGEIIDKLQDHGFSTDGIILNAGGYTHTSVAIGDTIKAIRTEVVEVHMSNISAREEFRHTSFITPHAKGIISGFGMQGYFLAARALLGI